MHKLTHAELLAQRLTNEQALGITRHPVSLMLHNIRSLYNVGSIFRTADAGLAQNLLLSGYTPYPPRKEIAKTALGAVDSVPWQFVGQSTNDAVRAVQQLKAAGTTVLALELTTHGRSLYDLTAKDFPLCLVLGNEISGVEEELLRECNGAMEIPMYGVKHSLNVSVAAGIALFEAVRRWNALHSSQ
jgi:tRNA G18 (ribose-2'-O)-methylase SpoU